MFSATDEALVTVAPSVAFAYLADPRNAGAWFTGAGFASAPAGQPQSGQTWAFERTTGTRAVQPVRMEVYSPPSRFVWRTTRPPLWTGFEWTMACEPVEGKLSSTTLRFTIRLRPGLVQWPLSLLGYRLVRRALQRQATTVVNRAAAAILSRPGPGKRRSPVR